MNIAHRIQERHAAIGNTIAETFENVLEQAIDEAFAKIEQRAKLIASSVYDLGDTQCVFSDGSVLNIHKQFRHISTSEGQNHDTL